ncbi:peptide chain release factor N(5)-glutamine methyltransferase [Luteolibacter sp. AS25]|uniref:peptide chain release factor N(5)-glutamine methyltransferase n=1 Tax=Luteolibacter sp. AS25 TaxID=3135776 RepID=UPI00398AAD2E
MKTVLETINGGAQYLEKRGVEDARRNMEHLLAFQLGCGRMQLYTQFDKPLEEADLAPLRELLKKRSERVPLQHILGSVTFYGRDFICDGRGLIPRPETEELVEMILAKAPQKPLEILDMGCGSGILGLTLAAERPESTVTMVDVSEDALSLTRENAVKLQIENVRIIQGNLFENIAGSFDVIAANLPYVPTGEQQEMEPELGFDPALALFSGEDGLDLLRQFIPASFGFLNPGGLLAMEIGHDQASHVARLLESSGFAEIDTLKDLSGIARFPFAKHP